MPVGVRTDLKPRTAYLLGAVLCRAWWSLWILSSSGGSTILYSVICQADNTDMFSKHEERNLTCRKSRDWEKAWAKLIWDQYCRVPSTYWQHTTPPFPYLNSLLLSLPHLSSPALYSLNSSSFAPKYSSTQKCWHDSEVVTSAGIFFLNSRNV